MFKTIAIALLLLVSPTEALGKGKNNKVVKPDSKNGKNNLVGGKTQPTDDIYFGNDDDSKLKRRIIQLS